MIICFFFWRVSPRNHTSIILVIVERANHMITSKYFVRKVIISFKVCTQRSGLVINKYMLDCTSISLFVWLLKNLKNWFSEWQWVKQKIFTELNHSVEINDLENTVNNCNYIELWRVRFVSNPPEWNALHA